VCCGVLSGNRNFEGRIHPNTRANYLASPLLVIAYAIAGTVDIDFEKEPLGKRYCYLSIKKSSLKNNETEKNDKFIQFNIIDAYLYSVIFKVINLMVPQYSCTIYGQQEERFKLLNKNMLFQPCLKKSMIKSNMVVAVGQI